MKRALILICVAALQGCSCGGSPMGNGVDASAVDADGPADAGGVGIDGAAAPDGASGDDGDSGASGASGDDGGTGGDGGLADGDGGPTNGDGGSNGPIGDIVISEVVVYPVHDWSDSAANGVPYDDRPGAGIITSFDEYVELQNVGSTVADLSGWLLEMNDQTPASTDLSSHANVLVSPGSTLSALAPGAFVVIGNPAGFSSTDVFVVLRASNGAVVDDVEIGGNTGTRDAEADGTGDGAPSPSANGFARGAFEEAIARPDGAADTDDDQVDFVAMYATPLRANINPAPPSEGVAPAVVDSSTGASFRVTSHLSFTMSEAVDWASITTGSVVVTSGGAAIGVDAFTFTDDDTRVRISAIGRLPFDSDIDVRIRGGASGVRDLSGNALAADYVFSVHTERAPTNPGAVVINEIVASPLQDWNNDAGGDGVIFSSTPGTGNVDSEDEWIELLNLQTSTLDLSGYTLTVYSGFNVIGPARSVTRLGGSGTKTIVIFGTSTDLSAVASGDRVVVGNPIGSMSFDFFLELRDETGRLVDTVEVGGNATAEDRGGDGLDNGAPAPGADGRALALTDESIARRPDGRDTGSHTVDFIYAVPTLGTSN